MKNFNSAEAALYLGLSLGSLRNIRSAGLGPHPCGISSDSQGRPLIFRQDDLDRWQSGRVLIRSLERFQWRTLPLDRLQKAASVAGIEAVA